MEAFGGSWLVTTAGLWGVRRSWKLPWKACHGAPLFHQQALVRLLPVLEQTGNSGGGGGMGTRRWGLHVSEGDPKHLSSSFQDILGQNSLSSSHLCSHINTGTRVYKQVHLIAPNGSSILVVVALHPRTTVTPGLPTHVCVGFTFLNHVENKNYSYKTLNNSTSFYSCPSIYLCWDLYLSTPVSDHHLVSFLSPCRTPVSVSCWADLMVMISCSFCLTQNVLISPSFFKDSSTGYRSLGFF